MSTSDEGIQLHNEPKKRKKTGRMSDVNKKLRLATHEAGLPCQCKRFKCYNDNVTTEHDRKEILRYFNQLQSHDEQNMYLAGLITVLPVMQRRPRKGEEEAKLRDATFAYRVRVTQERKVVDISVCAKAFCSFHGISKNKLYYLQKSLKSAGCAPMDKRGKHSKKHRQLNRATAALVENHIKSFKSRQSHYSLKDSKHKTYLPESLNIKKMYKLFKELHPAAVVSYDTYRMIFNTKFNISFGYPRTDTCALCDEYFAKVKALSVEKDKQKIDHLTTMNILHKKKAESFYNLKKKTKIQARQNRKKEAICIDFAKNVSLPNIATNDVYYKRQLAMYSFNVHVLATGESIFYVYHEAIAKKGPNEVASFLFHFIMNYLDDEVRELEIFCDSAGGQNKNYTIFKFIHYITNNQIHGLTDIKITFPVRGHSYLECDKNVGLWNIKAPMEIPEDFEEMVKLSRSKPSPFTVVRVTKEIVLDWKTMLQKKYVAKCPFKTQPIKIIHSSSSHSRLLQYRTTYFGEMLTGIIRAPRQCLPLEKGLFELPSSAYNGLLPISSAKFKDLQSLMKFCTAPTVKFFRKLPHD